MACFVPMIVTMLLSVWRPMFFHRFLIICLVPFLHLAAAGLGDVRNLRARTGLAMGIVVCRWWQSRLRTRRYGKTGEARQHSLREPGPAMRWCFI